MQGREATVFSNRTGLSVRVCPRGHVYLYVGHTCLTFRKNDFVELSEVIQAAVDHIAEHSTWWEESQSMSGHTH